MEKKSRIFKVLVNIAAILTFLILFMVIIDVVVKGIPNLNLDMFSIKYTSENLSMLPAIINTILMVVIALLIAGPIGILTSVYLNEYAKKDNPLIKPVRLTTQTLAGIPSIVYGLFGSIFFVTFLGWKYSLLAGAFTLSIMILPLIIAATEEALKSVPNSLREASFGLGAMNLRTIFKVVVPPAMPGILAGIVLSIGRIVGETAALLYTAGANPTIPKNFLSPARTLAVHMYILSGEARHRKEAYAAGVVLLILVLIINFISTRLAGRIGKEGINE